VHLPPLVHDLGLILAVAGGVAIIFRFLRQPIVLGYLLAGILIGPHVTIIPTVLDTANVKVWAELGVIFLLFVLGLEFNFRKLFEVGRPALIAAVFEVVVMTALGFGTGWLLGWNPMDSLFLGSILAISSTTIIVKAFEELGIKTQGFASLVFGILVIEDLCAILLLAILSTVAGSSSIGSGELFGQVGSLALLLAAVVPIGLWITPRFFRLIRSQLNDETRVIISLALCLGLVIASTAAGFSPALGAFLMGAFMGETSEGERVERFLKPIRDLFGAIFFTSIGMLVDPHIIFSNLPLVLGLSLVTIVGKILSTTAGALSANLDRRTSLQAGMCLGQIGEFSFIIATLGLTLNVIRPELYPLAVSISVITTFSTPYLIRFAAFSRYLARSRSLGSPGKATHPRLWDGHLVEFEIHPHFLHSGLSLQELKLREKFGISLIALIRGERKLIAPSRNDLLMPFDRIVVLGTDPQLAAVEEFLKSERHDLEDADEFRFGLEKIILKSDHPVVGRNLRQSGIREKFQGIVLGIERKKERILNPDSSLIIKSGDVLWVYGRRDHLKNWHREQNDPV